MGAEDIQSGGAAGTHSSTGADAGSQEVNPVTIQPTPVEEDAKAVDIHVDGDPFLTHPLDAQKNPPSVEAAREIQNVTAQDLSSSSSSSSSFAASIWLAPARAAKDAVHSYSASHVQFRSVDASTKGQSLGSTDGSAAAAASSSPPQDRTVVDASPSQPSLVTPQGDLTEEDLVGAMPHPDCYFHPALMQWQLVLRVDDPSRALRSTQQAPAEAYPSLQLWKRQGVARKDDVPDWDAKPILSIHTTTTTDSNDTTAEEIVSFERWVGSQGSEVWSTSEGAIQSVIPSSLLQSFKNHRLQNPRVGVTGIFHFQEAMCTLIRIVGNTANGESRGVSTSGKLITTKLGLDDTTLKILRMLGFRPADVAEDGVTFSTYAPPDMKDPLWQLRIRRAWIEFVLWYDYQCQRLKISDPLSISSMRSSAKFIPQPRYDSHYATSAFGFEPEQENEVFKQKSSTQVKLALSELGACEGSTDAVVDYCYLLNVADCSFQERLPFFNALHRLVDDQYQGSDLLQTRLAIEKSTGLFTIDELKQAYQQLNIEFEDAQQALTIDNSFIVELYSSTANASTANVVKLESLKEALGTISASRGRPSMLESAKGLQFELDVTKAYEILEVQTETEDDFISAAFQLALSESQSSASECTEALRVIAEARKSTELRKLYRKTIGQEDEWEAPAPDLPAGLNNIGNTCYLNSVLQYFYAIRPLRERVLEAGQSAAKTHDEADTYQVVGRKISRKELDRSYRFVTQLAQLFLAMMTSPVSAVTPERDLAYLALVSSRWEEDPADASPAQENDPAAQGIAANEGEDLRTANLVEEPQPISSVDSRAHPLPASVSSPEKNPNHSTTSSRDASHGSVSLKPPSLPPRPAQEATSKEIEIGQRRNSLMQLGAQQDVSECLDNVMGQVEAALTAQPNVVKGQSENNEDAGVNDDSGWIAEGDLLRRLFLGRTCQRLEVDDALQQRGPSIHVKREVFKTLPIDVLEEGRDIYDGLDGFFDEETLEGPNGRPMQRTVTLTDAPAVLQIQLQRVQYDRTRGVFKSQAHLNMGESLFMDRYLDFDPLNAADQMRLEKRKRSREIRRKVAELRSRIKQLRPSQVASVSRSLSRTGELLFGLKSVKRPLNGDEGTSDSSKAQDPASAESSFDTFAAQVSDESLGGFLAQEASRLDAEVAAAEEELAILKAEVESLWSTERRVEYVLSSVFMHRGEASHGHYFLNQRRLSATDRTENEAATTVGDAGGTAELSKWFKYNDNIVQETPIHQVLRDTTGATPYLVSFVRKDMQDEVGVFDTVCRLLDMGNIGSNGGGNGSGKPSNSQPLQPLALHAAPAQQQHGVQFQSAETVPGDVNMPQRASESAATSDAMDLS